MKHMFMLGFVLGLSGIAYAQSARALVLEGNELYESGEYAKAGELYERAMERGGRTPESVYNRANAAYRAGDLETAASLYRDIRAMPGAGGLAADAAHNLGRVILDRARSDESLAQDPEAMLDRLREAERAFRNALDLSPDDADAARNLELTRRNIDRLETQIERMKKQQQQQQRMSEELDELADEQQQQAQQNQSQQQSAEQSRERQQSISEQTQRAQQQARQMSEDAPSQQQKESARQASESLDRAREAQRRAQEALEQGDTKQAARAQTEAAEKLREASEQLGEQPQEQPDQQAQQSEEQQPSDQQAQQQQDRRAQQQGESEQSRSQQSQQGRTGEEMSDVERLVAELLEKERRDREARRALLRRAPGTEPVEKDW